MGSMDHFDDSKYLPPFIGIIRISASLREYSPLSKILPDIGKVIATRPGEIPRTGGVSDIFNSVDKGRQSLASLDSFDSLQSFALPAGSAVKAIIFRFIDGID